MPEFPNRCKIIGSQDYRGYVEYREDDEGHMIRVGDDDNPCEDCTADNCEGCENA